MPVMPKLDEEKCDCCGLCVSVCECGAIVMTNQKITIIDTDDCGWCTLCELVCPNNAIICAYEIVFNNET
jgi:MinD superfamily P-loop ATPase